MTIESSVASHDQPESTSNRDQANSHADQSSNAAARLTANNSLRRQNDAAR